MKVSKESFKIKKLKQLYQRGYYLTIILVWWLNTSTPHMLLAYNLSSNNGPCWFSAYVQPNSWTQVYMLTVTYLQQQNNAQQSAWDRCESYLFWWWFLPKSNSQFSHHCSWFVVSDSFNGRWYCVGNMMLWEVPYVCHLLISNVFHAIWTHNVTIYSNLCRSYRYISCKVLYLLLGCQWAWKFTFCVLFNEFLASNLPPLSAGFQVFGK